MTGPEPDPGGVALGRAPSSPFRFHPSEWLTVFKRAGQGFLSDNCMGLGQQVAYSSALALFPTAAFLLGLLAVLGLFGSIQSFLDTVAPSGVISFIQGLQNDSHGGTGAVALVVGAAGAIWTASGAMGTVMQAVNIAYDRFDDRSFVRKRVTAVVLVVLFGVTIVALAVLLLFGGPLGEAIADHARLGTAFTWAWRILRWPAAFVAVLILFGLVYYFSPNVQQRHWQWITPGSVVGAGLWLLLSGLFTVYVTFAGSYSKTYGSLAAAFILLVWLNYSAWAILFGAELNAELDRQADIDAAGGENAGLVHPSRRR
ncbi:MAG TPA: YihY/virulence factor BrkB family protein [Gaiellaceae bacterium]|nr:YihY/virulence factor BrkB family protein [Gaiellaceae bacterium]